MRLCLIVLSSISQISCINSAYSVYMWCQFYNLFNLVCSVSCFNGNIYLLIIQVNKNDYNYIQRRNWRTSCRGSSCIETAEQYNNVGHIRPQHATWNTCRCFSCSFYWDYVYGLLPSMVSWWWFAGLWLSEVLIQCGALTIWNYRI